MGGSGRHRGTEHFRVTLNLEPSPWARRRQIYNFGGTSIVAGIKRGLNARVFNRRTYRWRWNTLSNAPWAERTPPRFRLSAT